MAEPTTWQEAYDRAYQDSIARGDSPTEARSIAKNRADQWAKESDPEGILAEVRAQAPGIPLGIGVALLSDKKYGAQLMDVLKTWRTNKNLALDKLYKSDWARLTKDARENYLLFLEKSDTYFAELQKFKDSINKALVQEGYKKLDDVTLENYFKLGKSEADIFRDIAKQFEFAPGAVGGRIGDFYSRLKTSARRNGIAENMIASVLGFSDIKEALAALQEGEDINTFERKFRNYAKTAMPDYVKGLLDEGSDLDEIISPYRSVMVDELEIPYNSIDVTDRYVQNALANQVNLYDFRKGLRRDPRWQYTERARNEMADTAMNLLRNFGFMG